ncbi:MAG TPA: 1,4-alpha-glucan branching protein GlgB [Gemmatimonadaceae bacterium]|nr:1,4-alpha-glucan branching protein GlgB [Gemmatimonadaceae bacterium]
MSPEPRDDDKEPRESPPPDREREQPRGRVAKRGKTRPNPSRDASAPTPETPARGDSSDSGETTRREAGGSSTVERPPRTARKTTTRATPKRESAGMPEDPQDELPPQGDALLPRVEKPETTSAARPSRPRGGGGGKSSSLAALLPSPSDLGRILSGEHSQPHNVLGAHTATVAGTSGVVIRALMPNAIAAEAVLEADSRVVALDTTATGLSNLYCGFIADAKLPLRYRLRFHFADGAVWEHDDPYRFLPTIGDVDLHLFGEGTHRRLWEKLGAHIRTMDGVEGTSFAVWAPNARRVSIVGDFCGWDGRIFPMRSMGSSGVFELFVPEIKAGALYKYEMVTSDGLIRVKTDPFAFKLEQHPGTASIVEHEGAYRWGDGDWMTRRDNKGHWDVLHEPVLIYEVHLGSWARVPEQSHRPLSYREIAPRLADHVSRLGFTHVELMPVMEHPFYGSWGYQVSGYYAPTSRYGTPDDFRFLVDTLHQRGVGVILDWVPAHFPKDDYALRRFDGTALYEHADPRLGEHPDWGTLIFNYGRNEVRNFLVANALYWLQEFHTDGLRVDAVASMLYLDYSRKAGQWMRNRFGGRENLEAVEFLKQFNETIRDEEPGCFTVAEESTAWPNVTKPASEGGLGFTFKWNMGWMHDTLVYFTKDPVYRFHHHDQLTFAMMYEYSEHFIMPLSHDEVVHLKGSLYSKMPGDHWQKLANLRLLLAYMLTRPGKKLLFMGTEMATPNEWDHDQSLDWHLLETPDRARYISYVERLGHVYREQPALWREDPSWEGFGWIDVADRDNSVISYVRRAGDQHVIIVLNMTPVPRESYRLGVPDSGTYVKLLSSDDPEWGGSGYGAFDSIHTEPSAFHGYPQSVALTLPPLGAVLIAPRG